MTPAPASGGGQRALVPRPGSAVPELRTQAAPQGAPGGAHREPGSPSGPPLRVLIVDDHSLIRRGLRQILTEAFPNVIFGEANNGNEALQLIAKDPWCIVLLDLSLPGKTGLDVLAQLSQARKELRVLVLSMHAEDQYALRVLRAGASGYLAKNTAPEELVRAVRKILSGGRYISSAVAENLAGSLSAPAIEPPHGILSEREHQVLRMIAQGMRPKEIAYDLSLSVKTISTYRTRIMSKLKLKTTADLIRYSLLNHLVD